MIRQHFNVDPLKLSEQEFIELSQEALWIDKMNTERTQQIYSSAITELAVVIFRAQTTKRID